jgi:hypothetical protein
MSQLSFDANAFGAKMHAQSLIKLEKYDTSNFGWEDKDHFAMKYKDGNGRVFRTWRQDVSVCRQSAAILVSSKLDQDRDGYDDHLVMLASFNREKAFVTAQASVQSFKHSRESQSTPIVVAKEGIDVVTTLSQSIAACIKTILGKHSDDGFEYLSTIASINLQCMQQSIVLR